MVCGHMAYVKYFKEHNGIGKNQEPWWHYQENPDVVIGNGQAGTVSLVPLVGEMEGVHMSMDMWQGGV